MRLLTVGLLTKPDFIRHLTKPETFEKVVDVPNSMSVLTDLLPLALAMSRKQFTVTPTPYNRNPTHETLHPTHETLHPAPETRDPQPHPSSPRYQEGLTV